MAAKCCNLGPRGSVTYLDVFIQLLVRSFEEDAVVFHAFDKGDSHQKMFNPRGSRQGTQTPMGNIVYLYNRVLVSGEVVKVHRQAELSHSVEGIVLKPLADVERLALTLLELQNQLVRMVVDQRFGPIQRWILSDWWLSFTSTVPGYRENAHIGY